MEGLVFIKNRGTLIIIIKKFHHKINGSKSLVHPIRIVRRDARASNKKMTNDGTIIFY